MATQVNNKGISRRRFLSGLAVASAASVVGTSLLAPRKAMAATDAKANFTGEVLSGSHWGAFRAKVVDGVWVETVPLRKTLTQLLCLKVFAKLFTTQHVLNTQWFVSIG